jgi:hypothetical protein
MPSLYSSMLSPFDSNFLVALIFASLVLSWQKIVIAFDMLPNQQQTSSLLALCPWKLVIQ